MGECVDGLDKLFFGDDEGGHEVENGTERAEEVAGFTEGLFDSGHLVGVGGVEFDDADHAEKAGLFDG